MFALICFLVTVVCLAVAFFFMVQAHFIQNDMLAKERLYHSKKDSGGPARLSRMKHELHESRMNHELDESRRHTSQIIDSIKKSEERRGAFLYIQGYGYEPFPEKEYLPWNPFKEEESTND